MKYMYIFRDAIENKNPLCKLKINLLDGGWPDLTELRIKIEEERGRGPDLTELRIKMVEEVEGAWLNQT